MGRQRERNLRLRLGEDRAALGKRIDLRGANFSVPVGAQMVGAKGINGDQDNGRWRWRVLREAVFRSGERRQEEGSREREAEDALRPAQRSLAKWWMKWQSAVHIFAVRFCRQGTEEQRYAILVLRSVLIKLPRISFASAPFLPSASLVNSTAKFRTSLGF